MAQARPPSKLLADIADLQLRELAARIRAVPPWEPRPEWRAQAKDRLLQAYERRYPRA
jgi:hypothetical protein